MTTRTVQNQTGSGILMWDVSAAIQVEHSKVQDNESQYELSTSCIICQCRFTSHTWVLPVRTVLQPCSWKYEVPTLFFPSVMHKYNSHFCVVKCFPMSCTVKFTHVKTLSSHLPVPVTAFGLCFHCTLQQKSQIDKINPSNKTKQEKKHASLNSYISALIVRFVTTLQPESKKTLTDISFGCSRCHFGSAPNHHSRVKSLTSSSRLVQTNHLTVRYGREKKNKSSLKLFQSANFSGRAWRCC